MVTLLCFIWLGSDFAFTLSLEAAAEAAEGAISGGAAAMDLLTQWATAIIDNPLPPLYLGVIISGLCGYLQTLGQKDIPAERAAIIYSLDPVYAAGFSWLFLGQGLGLQGWIGSALIMSGVWLSSSRLSGSIDNDNVNDTTVESIK